MKFPPNDTEFQETRVRETTAGSITMTNGWSIGIPDGFEPRPCPGDPVRTYGRGIGSIVRGLFVAGREVWYRTESEQKAHLQGQAKEQEKGDRADFERDREYLNTRYDALPEVFRRRIDKFRANNSDFRWKFESYEMFVCEEAVRITDALKTQEAVEEYSKATHKEQKVRFEMAEGHSGNTHGMALRLAWIYLGDDPDNVVMLHGALAPLVGSQEYGCVPREVTP